MTKYEKTASQLVEEISSCFSNHMAFKDAESLDYMINIKKEVSKVLESAHEVGRNEVLAQVVSVSVSVLELEDEAFEYSEMETLDFANHIAPWKRAGYMGFKAGANWVLSKLSAEGEK